MPSWQPPILHSIGDMSAATRTSSSADRRAERRQRLREVLKADDLDALLATDLTNIRYLTGFTGSNAALLLTTADDDASLLCTDSRYRLQAAQEAPGLALRIDRACDLALLDAAGSRRIGFEEHVVTVARHRAMVGAAHPGAALVPVAGRVEKLREVKDADEIAALRSACAIADTALAEFYEAGGLRVGRTERQAARDLDERMRTLGSLDTSFPTILAAGENSAIPHHQPTDRELRRGDLVKIDFGAVSDGYHSDMTRVFVLGPPAGWQTELHALVVAAQAAGCAAIGPGVSASDVDAAARDVIVAAGHGEHFGHGLGHGVGLEVHEAPWFAPQSTGIMGIDMTVTVEPGVYLPGRGGVRIEDCGVVGSDGFEPLTLSPRDLLAL